MKDEPFLKGFIFLKKVIDKKDDVFNVLGVLYRVIQLTHTCKGATLMSDKHKKITPMVVVAFIIACSFLFVLAKLGFIIQENLGYVFF